MTEQPNVETQAWREQVEWVQRGLTGGMKDQWKAQKSLDALTAQIEELEANTRHLRNLHDWRAKGEREALIRLAVAERDLASSQEAALLLHKRVEELEATLERIRENARSWHGPVDDHGHAKALAVIATWCDVARPAPLARDPEWPPSECVCAETSTRNCPVHGGSTVDPEWRAQQC